MLIAASRLVGGGIDEALRVAKQRLTPMRRSQTLEEVLPCRDDVWQDESWQDELPSASKWITEKTQPRRQSDVLQKRPVSILRESPSDPHPPPRRLAPIQGSFANKTLLIILFVDESFCYYCKY